MPNQKLQMNYRLKNIRINVLLIQKNTILFYVKTLKKAIFQLENSYNSNS